MSVEKDRRNRETKSCNDLLKIEQTLDKYVFLFFLAFCSACLFRWCVCCVHAASTAAVALSGVIMYPLLHHIIAEVFIIYPHWGR